VQLAIELQQPAARRLDVAFAAAFVLGEQNPAR
jgi:hypothetical protein